jgi:hypothetical protein
VRKVVIKKQRLISDPSFLGKRRSIQLPSIQTPLRHVLVHDRDEMIIVMPLDEVHEFVKDDIFEALHRLFGEFKFSQIRRASMLQVPHLVFIFLMPQSVT